MSAAQRITAARRGLEVLAGGRRDQPQCGLREQVPAGHHVDLQAIGSTTARHD